MFPPIFSVFRAFLILLDGHTLLIKHISHPMVYSKVFRAVFITKLVPKLKGHFCWAKWASFSLLLSMKLILFLHFFHFNFYFPINFQLINDGFVPKNKFVPTNKIRFISKLKKFSLRVMAPFHILMKLVNLEKYFASLFFYSISVRWRHFSGLVWFLIVMELL